MGPLGEAIHRPTKALVAAADGEQRVQGFAFPRAPDVGVVRVVPPGVRVGAWVVGGGGVVGGEEEVGAVYHPLLPKHSKLDSSERTMKDFLETCLAASPLTTTHVLSSWNMVFTEVLVTESVDDVDLPCPSAAIPMPAPLLSVVPDPVSDSEEASEAEAEADKTSGAGVDNNIDVLSVPSTPPVQRAAKRRAETRLDRLAKRFRAAPCDVIAERVAGENRERAREAREAVQTSDGEGTVSCAVLLTMSERE